MPTPVNWRYCTTGSKVWVKVKKKWYPGIIDSLGKNLQEKTNVGVNVPELRMSVKRKLLDIFSYKDGDKAPEG